MALLIYGMRETNQKSYKTEPKTYPRNMFAELRLLEGMGEDREQTV